MSVKVTKDGLSSLLASLNALQGSRLLVGVPSVKAERKDEDDTPINNAALAYIHDNGAPEQNIPARPFLGVTVKEKAGYIAEQLKRQALDALDGNLTKVRQRFDVMGLSLQAAIRARITSGPFAPLSERTLAARRARGVKRTKPLIDTGQLRQSISYVIEENE